MGKRILVQRRGRGGMRYRSHPKGKIAPASYPFIEHDKTTIGIVKDLLHERGRSVPLAKIIFNNNISYVPAVAGLRVLTLHLNLVIFFRYQIFQKELLFVI